MICVNGETYRWSMIEGWINTSSKEIRPWLRETAEECRFPPPPNSGPCGVTANQLASLWAALEQESKREVPVSQNAPYWLEEHPWDALDVLAFRNGFLNVRNYTTGVEPYFTPLSPKLFYTCQASFEFSTDAPRPEEWHKFLASLDQDPPWYDFLQEILGYCLWRGWDLHKFFQLIGPTRSGKGTISRILGHILGGERAIASPALKDFATSFGLEDCIDKPLCLVPEPPPELASRDDIHDIISRLKAVTGGDAVTVNRKHIKAISMQLRMKILMASNNYVQLPDSSGALLARCLPLKFTKSFRGNEDFSLEQKLKAEAPGITLWALEGLRRLHKNHGRFTIPESTRRELEYIESESAPLQKFIEEMCVVDTSKGCQSQALYEVYKQWCLDEEPLSEQKFAAQLRDTASSLTKDRLPSASSKMVKGCEIVKTAHDKPRRAPVWLGIYPSEAAVPVSPGS